jgi:hypothetical protein
LVISGDMVLAMRNFVITPAMLSPASFLRRVAKRETASGSMSFLMSPPICDDGDTAGPASWAVRSQC